MTIRYRDETCGTIRFGAGTYWRRGPIRLDISVGVFSTESAALGYAAACRSVHAVGGRPLLLTAAGFEFPLGDDDCLAYDADVLERDRSWADAAMPWPELLAAVASGDPFACVGRAALPLAPNLRPTPAEMRAGATDLDPAQCGQTANWLRETTSM